MSLSREIEEHLQFKTGFRVEMCESTDDESLVKVGGVSPLKDSNEKGTNIYFLKTLFEYGYTSNEDGAIVTFCRNFLLESKMHESQVKQWIDIFLKTSFSYICKLAEESSSEHSFMENLKDFKSKLDLKDYQTIFSKINLDVPPSLEITEEKEVKPSIDAIKPIVVAFDGKITKYKNQENKLFNFITQLDKVVLEQKTSSQDMKNQFNKNYGNFLNKIARYNLKGLLSIRDLAKLQLKLKEYSTLICSWNIKPQKKEENKSLFTRLSHRLFKTTILKANSIDTVPNGKPGLDTTYKPSSPVK